VVLNWGVRDLIAGPFGVSRLILNTYSLYYYKIITRLIEKIAAPKIGARI
jgi:hypothetical protein